MPTTRDIEAILDDMQAKGEEQVQRELDAPGFAKNRRLLESLGLEAVWNDGTINYRERTPGRKDT